MGFFHIKKKKNSVQEVLEALSIRVASWILVMNEYRDFKMEDIMCS